MNFSCLALIPLLLTDLLYLHTHWKHSQQTAVFGFSVGWWAEPRQRRAHKAPQGGCRAWRVLEKCSTVRNVSLKPSWTNKPICCLWTWSCISVVWQKQQSNLASTGVCGWVIVPPVPLAEPATGSNWHICASWELKQWQHGGYNVVNFKPNLIKEYKNKQVCSSDGLMKANF